MSYPSEYQQICDDLAGCKPSLWDSNLACALSVVLTVALLLGGVVWGMSHV